VLLASVIQVPPAASVEPAERFGVSDNRNASTSLLRNFPNVTFTAFKSDYIRSCQLFLTNVFHQCSQNTAAMLKPAPHSIRFPNILQGWQVCGSLVTSKTFYQHSPVGRGRHCDIALIFDTAPLIQHERHRTNKPRVAERLFQLLR
jgi:hypothetical protein